MRKILTFIIKLLCGFFGIIFLFGSFGGIITCFSDQSNLVLYISFILFFLVIGIILLKIAFNNQSRKHTPVKNTTIEKETPSSQYIETESFIAHTDGLPIADEEIPYLMQLGYENAVQNENASNNPKFHRTEQEEELAFKFMQTHDREFSILVNQFENLYQSANQTNDSSQRIDLLNQALIAFEKAKKYAYSKGRGGTIYFQDMYEYLHNSNNSCFSYADIIQECINSEIQQRDTISKIIQIIQENDGILQKNIYTRLPSISKSSIQQMIRNLENKGIITRIKKSNSYELHISDK